MGDPDWAEILEHLYQGTGRITAVNEDGDVQPAHHREALTRKLRTDLDLQAETHEETWRAVQQLLINDLADEDVSSGRAKLELEPDGFRIAHERGMSERQTDTNKALVLLTLALVLTNVIGIIPTGDLRMVSSLLVLGFLLWASWKTDIFDLDW